jgi:hypothetical protein
MNNCRNLRISLLVFLGLLAAASASWAGTITATVDGNTGMTAIFFSLPQSTQVSFDVPVEAGFLDPCSDPNSTACSYSITELAWIPSVASTGTNGTVLCIAGTCFDGRTVGLAYSTFLPAGIYQFVVIANDSSNTNVQSISGTLNIQGDFQILPEPSAGVLLAGGLMLMGVVFARRRNRESQPAV